MSYNLQDYIEVADRKTAFFEKYPEGVIIPEMVSDAEQSLTMGAVFKASIWKDYESRSKNLPAHSVGYSLSIKGDTSSMADKTSWVENCETSAIGRALAHMGFAVSNKCSREEMTQAKHNKSAMKISGDDAKIAKDLHTRAIKACVLDFQNHLGLLGSMLNGATKSQIVSMTPDTILQKRAKLEMFIKEVHAATTDFVDDVANDPQMEIDDE